LKEGFTMIKVTELEKINAIIPFSSRKTCEEIRIIADGYGRQAGYVLSLNHPVLGWIEADFDTEEEMLNHFETMSKKYNLGFGLVYFSHTQFGKSKWCLSYLLQMNGGCQNEALRN
jgi:hypothetical protein